jgi:hypothetical protein
MDAVHILDERFSCSAMVSADALQQELQKLNKVIRLRIGQRIVLATETNTTALGPFTQFNTSKHLEVNLRSAFIENVAVFIVLGKNDLRHFYTVAGFNSFFDDIRSRMDNCERIFEPFFHNGQLFAGLRIKH